MYCVSCWMDAWNEVINALVSVVLIGGWAIVSRCHLSGVVVVVDSVVVGVEDGSFLGCGGS